MEKQFKKEDEKVEKIVLKEEKIQIKDEKKTLKKEFHLKSYNEQTKEWPGSGKHIMAQYDDDSIIVYQAFNDKIADFAVKNQYFGGSDYSTTRMTWIKTNFLWMQYRSGWSSKSNQKRTLAIWIKREFFDKLLNHHFLKKTKEQTERGTIRIQWDPDHNPIGDPCQRKAIQIGLKGELLNGFLKADGDIIQIMDITDFCLKEYQKNVKNQKSFKSLTIPLEKEYIIKDEKLHKHLQDYDPNKKFFE